MKKIQFPLMLLLVLACTIGLYYLIFDGETTKLFYINTVVACLAEVVLLANIPIWSGEKMMTIKNAAVASFLNIYAILVFGWTTIYSLAIYNAEETNYKVLLIGLLLITLLFAVLCGMTAIGGGTAEKQAAELADKSTNKKLFVFSIQESLNSIDDMLSTENSEWKDATMQALRTIADKVGSMPVEKLSKNADIATEIKERMESIENLCAQFAASEEKEELQANITRKINQFKSYISTIKTLL